MDSPVSETSLLADGRKASAQSTDGDTLSARLAGPDLGRLRRVLRCNESDPSIGVDANLAKDGDTGSRTVQRRNLGNL